MGVPLVLIGYIQEAWPGAAGENEVLQRKVDLDAAIQANTDAVLAALPQEDNWPPLCKPMFGWPRADEPLITYRHRVIHCAASIKNADFAIRDWLDKFESLLRKLHWIEAYIRIDGGYIGVHEFHWTPKRPWLDALHDGYSKPPVDWDFTTTLEDLDAMREP